MTFFQTLVLGALQGCSELFPISSLGHTVIIPQLLGWRIDQASDMFLVFLVATHFATAIALFVFYLRDWVGIVKGVGRSLARRAIDPADTYAKLGWMIVLATVPVGILGVLFQKSVEGLLGSAGFVSIFLVGNGIVLFLAEALRRRRATRVQAADIDSRVAGLSWLATVKVGIAECLALIPGFSRTGATLSAGLAVGLDHGAAARFSFLLAAPVIFAAAALKLPDLGAMAPGIVWPIVAGSVASAVTAYFSVRFLEKYFKTKTLVPFAAYCVGAGLVSFLVLLLR